MMSDAGLRMSQSGRPRQQLAVGKHHFLAGGASEAIICSCINGRASISTLLGLAGPSDASSSSGRGRRWWRRRVAVAGGHSDHFSGLHDTVPSRRQASKQDKLRSCGGICGAPGQRGGGGPVNQVSRGIPKPAQS
jgi:hypothetical protein